MREEGCVNMLRIYNKYTKILVIGIVLFFFFTVLGCGKTNNIPTTTTTTNTTTSTSTGTSSGSYFTGTVSMSNSYVSSLSIKKQSNTPSIQSSDTISVYPLSGALVTIHDSLTGITLNATTNTDPLGNYSLFLENIESGKPVIIKAALGSINIITHAFTPGNTAVTSALKKMNSSTSTQDINIGSTAKWCTIVQILRDAILNISSLSSDSSYFLLAEELKNMMSPKITTSMLSSINLADLNTSTLNDLLQSVSQEFIGNFSSDSSITSYIQNTILVAGKNKIIDVSSIEDTTLENISLDKIDIPVSIGETLSAQIPPDLTIKGYVEFDENSETPTGSIITDRVTFKGNNKIKSTLQGQVTIKGSIDSEFATWDNPKVNIETDEDVIIEGDIYGMVIDEDNPQIGNAILRGKIKDSQNNPKIDIEALGEVSVVTGKSTNTKLVNYLNILINNRNSSITRYITTLEDGSKVAYVLIVITPHGGGIETTTTTAAGTTTTTAAVTTTTTTASGTTSTAADITTTTTTASTTTTFFAKDAPPTTTTTTTTTTLPDGDSWTEAPNATFGARINHNSIVFDNKIWVIAGTTEGFTRRNDVWYSEDGETWTEATSSAAFDARFCHTSVVFNNKMWVIGGNGGGGRDVWYSEDGSNWEAATESADFIARCSHTSVVFGGKIWVIAGNNDNTYRDDVWYTE